MRTKKEIKKRHKKSTIVKKRAVLLEQDSINGPYKTSLNIKYKADTQGWYKKLEMIAGDDSSYVTKGPKLTLEYFDGDIEVIFHHNNSNQRLLIPLYALGELVDAAAILNYYGNGRVFAKSKLRVKKDLKKKNK